MATLDGIKLFYNLTIAEKEQLEVFCQEKFVKKGEIIFKEGEEANALYILKDGEVKVLKNIKGIDVELGIINSEDILGEMALFGTTSRRMASAVAHEETTLITILSFSIKEMTLKQPDLLEKIKGIIEERNMENKISESNVR